MAWRAAHRLVTVLAGAPAAQATAYHGGQGAFAPGEARDNLSTRPATVPAESCRFDGHDESLRAAPSVGDETGPQPRTASRWATKVPGDAQRGATRLRLAPPSPLCVRYWARPWWEKLAACLFYCPLLLELTCLSTHSPAAHGPRHRRLQHGVIRRTQQ